MTSRYDLANGDPEQIKQFVCAIIDLAAAHHDNNVRAGLWSGQDLCDEYASSSRGLHRLMASGVYNKTRESLSARGKP